MFTKLTLAALSIAGLAAADSDWFTLELDSQGTYISTDGIYMDDYQRFLIGKTESETVKAKIEDSGMLRDDNGFVFGVGTTCFYRDYFEEVEDTADNQYVTDWSIEDGYLKLFGLDFYANETDDGVTGRYPIGSYYASIQARNSGYDNGYLIRIKAVGEDGNELDDYTPSGTSSSTTDSTSTESTSTTSATTTTPSSSTTPTTSSSSDASSDNSSSTSSIVSSSGYTNGTTSNSVSPSQTKVTTVVTVTSCSENKCSSSLVTTIYTTVCPETEGTLTSQASKATTTTVVTCTQTQCVPVVATFTPGNAGQEIASASPVPAATTAQAAGSVTTKAPAVNAVSSQVPAASTIPAVSTFAGAAAKVETIGLGFFISLLAAVLM